MGRVFRLCRHIYIYIYSRLKPIEYARKQGVFVGKDCRLGSPNFGTEPWLISIGDHVLISGNVQFITHDGGIWVFKEGGEYLFEDPKKYKDVIKYGKIKILDNCFIGSRSIIMPGVTIGPNAVVGAGSIVTKDVPEGMIVAGNPAHVITSVAEYAEKCLAQTPEYDKQAYKTNKRETVLKMLEEK